MIPVLLFNRAAPRALQRRAAALPILWATAAAGAALAVPPAASPIDAGAPAAAPAASCLESGDGYLRAHVAGAIEEDIDWPNSGTRCLGESKSKPPGVRISFRRDPASGRDLLFVFGLTAIREGEPAHATGANLTVILQGTDQVFGTLGDSRCTVDSLTQKPLKAADSYRIEARGFCTQPAHAVRGEGAVLVSTFEFAGPVVYDMAPPNSEASK